MKSMEALVLKALTPQGVPKIMPLLGLVLGPSLLALVVGVALFWVTIQGGRGNAEPFVTIGSKSLAGRVQEFDQDLLSALRKVQGVRGVWAFNRAPFTVWGGLRLGGQEFGSLLFLEALPPEALDLQVTWEPGDPYVPIVLGESFLFLYNTAFAPAYGLPAVGPEQLGLLLIELQLGGPMASQRYQARVMGISTRADTILAPSSFLETVGRDLGFSQEAPVKVLVQMEGQDFRGLEDFVEVHGLNIQKSDLIPGGLLRLASVIILGLGFVAFMVVILTLAHVEQGLALSMRIHGDLYRGLLHWGYKASYCIAVRTKPVVQLILLGIGISLVLSTIVLLAIGAYLGASPLVSWVAMGLIHLTILGFSLVRIQNNAHQTLESIID